MPPRRGWVILFAFLVSLGLDSSAQVKDGNHMGYVYCAKDQSDHLTPVFLDPCNKFPVGNLSCGQKLEVVAQLGTSLKVTTPDGVTRFMNSSAVSERPDQPVPIDIEAAPAPNCKTPERDPTKNRGPRRVFTPDPHFPRHRNRNEGSVLLGLMVGIDGRAHDIKVEGSLGKDYDEAAIEAVRQWRFEPALRDGQPVAVHLDVALFFRVIH